MIMRPQGPTFWLLDGRTGWRTAHIDGVSVSAVAGIRLASDPAGPLALTAADGSLGGITLPQGMALDAQGTLYLLDPETLQVRRFDPAVQRFRPLPTVGGHGVEARQFREATNIAVAGGDLYVADRGNRRVQVFDLRTLALRHVWGPWDAAGRPVAADAAEAWEPVDVTAHADHVYILDRRYGHVYRHRLGRDALQAVIDVPEAVERWTRIAVDRDGRIYLLDPATPRLEIYDGQGRRVGQVSDAGDVRHRFDPPPLRLDHRGRFCLPQSLARPCDRRTPQRPPPPEAPLALCASEADGGLLFDRRGNPVRVDPAEPPGPKLYMTGGVWISEALDSQIYRCQWHRIALELARLPAGTRVVISTYTDEEPRSAAEVRALPDHLWDTRYALAGEMQPHPLSDEDAADGPATRFEDVLVQSREGQYLWLKLELFGDGYTTPALRAIRVHYPRASYLAYLPAVYAADDESRWFLERFLSIFQVEWDRLEERIEEIARYFDPAAVPEGEFLAYLARWLALPLEGDWDGEQQRRLLVAAPQFYPRRGTPGGLRDYLRIYLQNLTGLSPEAQRGYPQIVEGFRERRSLMLSAEHLADLGHGVPLWGPGVVGRLQLDVFAREGEVRLVSTGDPERDLFHEYAHRFRVFVPAAWVRTGTDERLVRRALDAEKPAHTRYDLCLVEPRFRVGVQSTVGLDTIIGAYPVARLACPHEEDVPPSRPPRHRLGYDTVLAGRPADGVRLHLAPGTRVGMDTMLT